MQRSTAVNIFGALNVVFSIFTLLGVFDAWVVRSALPHVAVESKSLIFSLMQNPAYAFWSKCLIPLDLLSFVLLLTAGIGLLRRAEWARALSIAYGIYAIAVQIAVAVMDSVFVVHPLLAQTAPPAADGAIAATTVVVFHPGNRGALSVIYAVALIVFMARLKMIASFRQSVPPSVEI